FAWRLPSCPTTASAERHGHGDRFPLSFANAPLAGGGGDFVSAAPLIACALRHGRFINNHNTLCFIAIAERGARSTLDGFPEHPLAPIDRGPGVLRAPRFAMS